MRVVLPFRGEFGLKLWWFLPAVHYAKPDVVMGEEGEEALYPSCWEFYPVPRRHDSLRRNSYAKDGEFIDGMRQLARERWPDSELLAPTAQWPRARFVPEPHVRQDVGPLDVMVCPRRRTYGAEKNWPAWSKLTDMLHSEGLRVFAGGAPDSSYPVPCDAAWEYPRCLDATIEAILKARLVIATDAGLAHLAVLCGRPLLMITHGDGLVAPGPVLDENGRAMEPRYWPVKMERYVEANHTGSEITLVREAWYSPERVLAAALVGLEKQGTTAEEAA